MPAYDGDGYEPPAAVAHLRVIGPSGRALTDVPFLIDSGADVSAVPLRVVHEVNARLISGGAQIASYDGTVASCNLVELVV